MAVGTAAAKSGRRGQQTVRVCRCDGAKTTVKYLLAMARYTSLAPLLIGCGQPVHERGETAATPNELIRRGDLLDDAFQIIRAAGLAVREGHDAEARADGRSFKKFRVGDWNDALFIVAVFDDRDRYVVDSIDWHRNWNSDSRLPKSQRKYELDDLQEINLAATRRRSRSTSAEVGSTKSAHD